MKTRKLTRDFVARRLRQIEQKMDKYIRYVGMVNTM